MEVLDDARAAVSELGTQLLDLQQNMMAADIESQKRDYVGGFILAGECVPTGHCPGVGQPAGQNAGI